MRAALRRGGPFGALESAELDQIVESANAREFIRRKPLFIEGATASDLFVLASGRVRVVRGHDGDRLLTVAYRVAGDLVGETALADGRTYRTSASATEPVVAVAVPMRVVRRLLREHAGFADRMMRLMVERRLDAEGRIESLLSRSVESRVSEFLIDASQRHGVPDPRGLLIAVRYTHQEIADYVGSTRETVTLSLGELKRRKLIVTDHRRIVITKLGALEKLV
ncbi:MAG: Crp/Fnr family transcriptional regulator [Myxococcales bacterium]|nr:Crp/Fnr family transcriptional regulator [Myxococcales bacterium]